ncbi:quinolinate synthase [candidate division WOR-1 bacterium RIFCSPHIGHO2_01_FULL_53_15]|uniref:Quinolinate synthase n=1 Tax=candidate division WOR-1 bacterium RIFCSPHIGHO2_01_FULL_53_15 TaxID=1802564 RepID=A0A1F4Q4D9_UNCSA|nr:MAG: quinolinate synthase [candidate division WOR-1 bacterium RIFCSPHIGHO2_01_FULL_53_15]OGC13209.1 MAG: quinolinate synthase [candidate division WOR-1 bacterium RIFCSPHIGHO2_02_FULL_53_26]
MSDIFGKIQKLKKERNAVILAHNYQRLEVQDIADYVGDSLGLSSQAAKVQADVIVFCGVHFMAETAAILCPEKKVIMPEVKAGCPMANMITVEKLANLKLQNPKAPVVCYVNTTAEIKAESDICCTSANAVKVVRSLPDNEVIFVPDKYLGTYTQSKVPEKKLILFDGYCPTHANIFPEHIEQVRRAHPRALVLVHPECRPEVTALADEVLSTGGMLKFVRGSERHEFIIGTETGIIYTLQKQNPGKRFYPASERAVCPNMKMTTLEKVLWSLEDLKTEVAVSKPIADKARKAIERMLEIGRQD